jgi:hypothetical protein
MPKPLNAIHAAADYYEPLFRARFVKAMKTLQKQVSITHLAMAMGNHRQATALVTTKMLTDALQPAAKVIKDAVNQGGKLGAKELNAVGKR